MFENLDYQTMLDRLLTDVKTKYPELDYREGSLIYNAIAATALELNTFYINADMVNDQSFIETASRTFLYKLSEQMGIDTSHYGSTKGTFKALFDQEIPIGSRWNLGLYNYTVIEQLDKVEPYFAYELECETKGSAPNSVVGTLTPIDDINLNLTYSELVSAIQQGREELTDDEIRKYYTNNINGTIVDGNKAQYEQWCALFDGIGNYKVFPLWNGNNTVKCSILNEINGVASEELIKDFQDYLDPGSAGMGDGVAPIGAIVTVTTATEHPINISATIYMKEGYVNNGELDETIAQYYIDRSYKSDYVSYSQIIMVILSDPGVENVTNVLLNGGTQDIKLEAEEIPVVGENTWTVGESSV